MKLEIQALLERAGLAGLQTIALDRIVANPDNPRQDFEEDELDALAASIRERGLLQPVSLFPPDAAGRHVLRFGERRVRAARRAGLEMIPAIICEPPSRAVQLVDQIIENDQRIGLSSIEMSRAIAALGEAGMTKAAIADQLGRSPSMISLYAALVEMPALLQALADRVTIRSLHDLYRLWRRHPDPVAAFVEETPSDQIDRRSVAAFAERLGSAPPPDAGKAGRPPNVGSPELLPHPGVMAAKAEPAPHDRIPDIGRVRVRCGERQGRLLFPSPGVAGVLLVRFDADDAPTTVAASTLVVIDVAPDDRLVEGDSASP